MSTLAIPVVRARTLRRLNWLWSEYKQIGVQARRLDPNPAIRSYDDGLAHDLPSSPADVRIAHAELAAKHVALRSIGLSIYRRHLQILPQDAFASLEKVEASLAAIQTKYGDPAPWSNEEFQMISEGGPVMDQAWPALKDWTDHLNSIVAR